MYVSSPKKEVDLEQKKSQDFHWFCLSTLRSNFIELLEQKIDYAAEKVDLKSVVRWKSSQFIVIAEAY